VPSAPSGPALEPAPLEPAPALTGPAATAAESPPDGAEPEPPLPPARSWAHTELGLGLPPPVDSPPLVAVDSENAQGAPSPASPLPEASRDAFDSSDEWEPDDVDPLAWEAPTTEQIQASDIRPAPKLDAAPEPPPLSRPPPKPVVAEAGSPESAPVSSSPAVSGPAAPPPLDLATTQITPAQPSPLLDDLETELRLATPGLFGLLGGRVRLLGLRWPVWLVAFGTTAAAAAAGFYGAVTYGMVPPTQAMPSASAVADAPSASAQVAAGDEAPGSVVARASQGEEAALEELRSRPAGELQVEEVIALAQGRDAQLHGALEKLLERVRAEPSSAEQPETGKALLEAVADARTATEALRGMAELPSAAGPDLLYEVWTGTRERTDATVMAEQLVMSKAVRGRASEALAVALDLRGTEECSAVKAILPRAIEHADRRALRLLGKLLGKRGCGPNKAADCYPCLRGPAERQQVADAVQAAKSRPGPRW